MIKILPLLCLQSLCYTDLVQEAMWVLLRPKSVQTTSAPFLKQCAKPSQTSADSTGAALKLCYLIILLMAKSVTQWDQMVSHISYLCHFQRLVQISTDWWNPHPIEVQDPTKPRWLWIVASCLSALQTLPSCSRKPALFGPVVSDLREAWQSVSTISRLGIGAAQTLFKWHKNHIGSWRMVVWSPHIFFDQK
jgi:hypothetical protein